MTNKNLAVQKVGRKNPQVFDRAIIVIWVGFPIEEIWQLGVQGHRVVVITFCEDLDTGGKFISFYNVRVNLGNQVGKICR